MKTTPQLLLVMLSTMFFSMKCIKETADCHYTIYLNNQTDKQLYAVCSYDYPDTSINFQNPMLWGNALVGANARNLIYSTGDRCLEPQIENYTKTGIISIFLFDAAEVQADWAQVRQQYKVLKRFDYSVDELRNTNFSIDYP
jgi:hypothetical protein